MKKESMPIQIIILILAIPFFWHFWSVLSLVITLVSVDLLNIHNTYANQSISYFVFSSCCSIPIPIHLQIVRCLSTRYTYNKTIPQTFYTKEDVILSFGNNKEQTKQTIPKDIPRTKKGLASGLFLASGEFYSRSTRYDDDKNVIEDILTPFDRPFYDLCRDDMWILDPLSLTVFIVTNCIICRMNRFRTLLIYYL